MPYVEGVSDWNEQEKRFDEIRHKKIVDRSEEYVDQYAVTTRRQTMAHGLTRTKLFEMILDVKGSIIECGVYRGQGLMYFYHLSTILEPYAFNRKIYGFDTFTGFRSTTDKDPMKDKAGLLGDVDYEFLKDMIKTHDMNRPVAHIPKAELVKGDAVKTIPEFVAAHPELIVALLYLDFDLYAPTKVALEQFLPLMPKGGIVVFDELNVAKWAGETTAFKEMFELNKIELKKFPFDPYVSYFVV
jgi:hypothetical protein